ncbi:MAG: NADH-quinone oxidoreductase subunit C [Mariprofundaceae bacterium]|nr:NADH-quinone oxidoreductase subunit C [Mariprofundaceae bacterium]
MIHEANTWFAERLSDHGIVTRYLEDHHPVEMSCLQIRRLDWTHAAEEARRQDMRFVSLWAAEAGAHDEEALYAYMAFAHLEHRHVLLRTDLNVDDPVLPDISRHYVAAVRMERSLQDMFGIRVEGLVDTRRWLKHEHWPEDAHPMRSSFAANTRMEPNAGEYAFIKAEGDGVYEYPVGPVHAGIIEPGHFRFHAVGEKILNMEERLGYAHKGIEKIFEGLTAIQGSRLAGHISGDSAVAHTWAFAQACENAAYLEVPERAVALRAILCERERMANHIGDIGGVCNDGGFAFMNVQMQRLREDMARAHQDMFGHRLLMDLIISGGVNCDLDANSQHRLSEQTQNLASEVEELRTIYADHPSMQERVIGSGPVSIEDAKSIGLLGYIGRASGVYADARVEEAYPPYNRLQVQIPQGTFGDVATRVWVRFEEIVESARLICNLLKDMPDGPVQTDFIAPEAGISGFDVIEGWRGEISAWVRFGQNGTIDRYAVRDPSEINWLGLELAVREVPVPDFPLNNKSFNCSYSGNDL